MADAGENRWGECPRCQEVNSQRAICCSKCGARLPWAAATSAAKPGVKTNAAASSAAFAKGASGPQNKSQAELESIMNGAQSTLQAKDEAWKPVGMKSKDSFKQPASDWRKNFDFWEAFDDVRVKAVVGFVLLLLVGSALRLTIFKPAPQYQRATAEEVAELNKDEQNENPGLLSGGNDFVAAGATAVPSAPAPAPAPAPAAAAGGGLVVAPQARVVTYRVEGTAAQTQIKFANGGGFDTRQRNKLPWSIGCEIPSGGTASVSALIKSQGDVTVSIEVDGQVVSRKSGAGVDQVITCKGVV